jgi:hypothetical protein
MQAKRSVPRLNAVNCPNWPPSVHAVINLPLPRTPEVAILNLQPTRIGGISVHYCLSSVEYRRQR